MGSIPHILFCAICTVTYCTLITAQQKDPRVEAPWVASIFQKQANTTDWTYLCGATITSRYTVITSARCILPKIIPKSGFATYPFHPKYANLKIVAGLKTQDFKNRDKFTQEVSVGQIRDVYKDSEGGDSPHNDLAAVRTIQEFDFNTPYVKPVQLTEKIGTFLEANATKPGDIFSIAGFENVKGARSASGLKIYQLKVTDIGPCIKKYSKIYPTHYFKIVCGKSIDRKIPVPCTLIGSGMVANVNGANYLLGVYSSNTQLGQYEFLGGKNAPKDFMKMDVECNARDVIFFEKLGFLGRWGISHNFCDADLAMCKNNRCRPWTDLCDGKKDCTDGSDESPKMCLNQT